MIGICNSDQCHLPISLLKEWYEGYRINYFDTAEKQQISVEIYNPNSVCLAVRRNECACFWSGTSSNDEVAFHKSEDGSKTEFNNNKVLNKLIYLLNDLKVFNKTIRHIDWNKARRKIEASIRVVDKLKRLYNNKYNKNIEYENRKLRRPEICFLKID